MQLPNALLLTNASEAHNKSAASFLALCKLSQILGELLPLVYALNPNSADIGRQVRRLECMLDEWESTLPSFLRVNADETQDQVNGSSNLHFCFLSVKLLLCRVAFKARHLNLALEMY